MQKIVYTLHRGWNLWIKWFLWWEVSCYYE